MSGVQDYLVVVKSICNKMLCLKHFPEQLPYKYKWMDKLPWKAKNIDTMKILDCYNANIIRNGKSD
ncbi:MAG: hypothetical protein H0U27_14145 [Nitrosopumilus sp.]|nr:hypothetical protein [Nitrosopumilus sp.]